MDNKAIIITSREYFSCKVANDKILSSEMLDILINHFKIDTTEIDNVISKMSLDQSKRNELITQMYLQKLFLSNGNDATVNEAIKRWSNVHVCRIKVDEASTIYLAPCLPRASRDECFIKRQDYLADVITLCLSDLNESVSRDNIFVISHDNDIVQDPVSRAVSYSDIKNESKLSILANSNILLNNMFLFVHVLSDCKIYETLVNKLSNEGPIDMSWFLGAIDIIKQARESEDMIDKFYKVSSEVKDFYNSLI